MPHKPLPKDFMWGCSTAAFQIEGAWNEDGKALSMWDVYSKIPGKTVGGDTGDVADDHYHRYKQDVQLMKEHGFKSYRFSISWPRVIDENLDGTGKVNEKGVEFYNNLIDCLVENGIEPLVTLYHWDLPLKLIPKLKGPGFLEREPLVSTFTKYARLCFDRFGDRVKKWITFNEPFCVCVLGYSAGLHAPGDTSHPGTYPYIAAHNLLLAHAHVVKLYRDEFQKTQEGIIGISLNTEWFQAETEDPRDIAAADRALAFTLGWFADPVFKGDYPAVMRESLGDRLPTFTEEEKNMLRGSSDFFGLNHYTTNAVSRGTVWRTLRSIPKVVGVLYESTGSFWRTLQTVLKVVFQQHYYKDIQSAIRPWPGVPTTDMGWPIVPWGLTKLLLRIHDDYKMPIIVTENGCGYEDTSDKPTKKQDERVEYYRLYISAMQDAIDKGADVHGYFAWSLMDNFEWSYGYRKRFGMAHVNYDTQVRTPRAAMHFMERVMRNHGVPQDPADNDQVKLQ